MDPSQLNLRTGLGDGHSEGIEAAVRRINSAYAVMIIEAIRTACVVCEHASRTEVTEEDQIHALKYQAKTFLHTLDDPEVVRDVLDAEHVMYGSDSEDDTVGEGPEIPEKDVRHGACECHVCAGVRAVVNAWDAWDPEDEAERYLKTKVDEAIQAVKES